jgi:hypothetical protein
MISFLFMKKKREKGGLNINVCKRKYGEEKKLK